MILVTLYMSVLIMYIAAWCAIPSVPNAVTAHLVLYTYCNDTHCYLNAGIGIRCNPNYTLNGYGVLRCAGYGQWHQPIPTCEGKYCICWLKINFECLMIILSDLKDVNFYTSVKILDFVTL